MRQALFARAQANRRRTSPTEFSTTVRKKGASFTAYHSPFEKLFSLDVGKKVPTLVSDLPFSAVWRKKAEFGFQF